MLSDERSIVQPLNALQRFASIFRRCDVDSLLNIGRLYREIAPTEKTIDVHIDLLRGGEFWEMECVSDIAKCVLPPASFRHS